MNCHRMSNIEQGISNFECRDALAGRLYRLILQQSIVFKDCNTNANVMSQPSNSLTFMQ